MFPVFSGFILWSDKPHSDYVTFGTMQTSVAIPPEQAELWGMILLSQPEEMVAE